MMAKELDTDRAEGIDHDQRPAMCTTTYTLPLPANPGLWKGVNEQMKPRFHKVGIVSIREGETPTRGRMYYEMRYTDPDTGLEVKRRIKVGVAGSSPVSRSTPSQKMIQK
jgi:hypothetical protein